MRPACRISKRALAFRGLVDDDEEFALMPLGEDFSQLAKLRRFGSRGLLGLGRLLFLDHAGMLPSLRVANKEGGWSMIRKSGHQFFRKDHAQKKSATCQARSMA